jgi:hypothetical protein
MNMVAATQPTWAETLSLRVGEIRPQAIDINLYEIIDPGAGELPATTAGSQVTIHVGDRLIRQYSLTEPAEIAATFTVVIASTGARVNASMSRRIAAFRVRLCAGRHSGARLMCVQALRHLQAAFPVRLVGCWSSIDEQRA